MSERVSVGYQQVTCKQCKRTYVCTPQDDYYDFTDTTDGTCIQCLMKEAGVKTLITVHLKELL